MVVVIVMVVVVVMMMMIMVVVKVMMVVVVMMMMIMVVVIVMMVAVVMMMKMIMVGLMMMTWMPVGPHWCPLPPIALWSRPPGQTLTCDCLVVPRVSRGSRGSWAPEGPRATGSREKRYSSFCLMPSHVNKPLRRWATV